MGQAPTVYPNPTAKEVTVAWPQAIQKSGSLKLYDIYGRQLLALTLGEGEMARTIALPDLPESVYVLQIRLDGFDFVKKLAIKH